MLPQKTIDCDSGHEIATLSEQMAANGRQPAGLRMCAAAHSHTICSRVRGYSVQLNARQASSLSEDPVGWR